MSEEVKIIREAHARCLALIARELRNGGNKAEAGELTMPAFTALFKQAEDLYIQAERLLKFLPEEK